MVRVIEDPRRRGRPNGDRGVIVGLRPIDRVRTTAPASCGDVVVVLALVRRDHRPEIVGRPLDVLSDRAIGGGALVVASVDEPEMNPRINIVTHKYSNFTHHLILILFT